MALAVEALIGWFDATGIIKNTWVAEGCCFIELHLPPPPPSIRPLDISDSAQGDAC